MAWRTERGNGRETRAPSRHHMVTKNLRLNRPRWCTPVILALRKPRKGAKELEAIPRYVLRLFFLKHAHSNAHAQSYCDSTQVPRHPGITQEKPPISLSHRIMESGVSEGLKGKGWERQGLTMVSSPSVRSIRKKMMAQNGERGSLVKASG